MHHINPTYQILSCPDGRSLTRFIEEVARTCYKSEDKIKEGSDLSLITNLIKNDHLAMIEFGHDIVVRFVSNRGFSHELVRHRLASFAQECLTGDTKVRQNKTIEELYERSFTPHGKTHNKTINLRSCNEHNQIVLNKVKHIFYKGVAPVYEVTTKLGYQIKATINHEFMTIDGQFQRLSNIYVNDQIMVNGRPSLLGKVAHPDTVTSIQYIGVRKVYDIEMESPFHNYIANGFVVHNSTRYCNYNKDKFGNAISVTSIEPEWLKMSNMPSTFRAIKLFNAAYAASEESYMALTKMGVPAQIAREVLPIGLKAEICIKTNIREWRHILRLRCSKKAHPRMRQLMLPLLHDLHERIPLLFDDLVEKYPLGQANEIQKNSDAS